MADVPPKHSLPTSSEQSSADFNWPPTDDELAQYGIEAVESEESGLKRSLPTSSEQRGADFNWPPTDDELAQYGVATIQSETSEPVCLETGETGEPPLASVALTQSDTARDGNTPGEWAAEMARVHALIVALTQPVEWRIRSTED